MDPKHANAYWRRDKEPSTVSQTALEHASAGDLPDDVREGLIDELVDAISERLLVDPDDSVETHAVVEEISDGIRLRVPNELWRRQPLGVICRPVHHRVNGEGSAVIADVYPRSADVAEDVMPVKHVAMDVVPTAVWLSKYIGGEGGYDPITTE